MDESIRVEGNAAACGRVLGGLYRSALRRRIAKVGRIRRLQNVPEDRIRARVREFRDRVGRVAPHWLEETGALARAAGVATDDVLMLNSLPPGFYPAKPHSCTAFLSIGRRRNLLLKIRDERNHVQSFLIQKTAGLPRLQIARDIGNLGAAHVLSEHGVGGANNTGSHTDFVSDEAFLNDCHVLRLIGERAGSVEDIPDIYRDLVRQQVTGGAAPGRGALYLFADRRRGLLLECVERGFVPTFVNSGTRVVSNHFLSAKARGWMSRPPNNNTARRKQRMEELLARRGWRPGPADVFSLCRDRKYHPHCLCNDDKVHFWMTVSAQLHVIDREDAGRTVNYFCCGNTRHSVFLPAPLPETESYVPLANGRFYEATNCLFLARRYPYFPLIERQTVAGAGPRHLYRAAYALIRGTAERPARGGIR